MMCPEQLPSFNDQAYYPTLDDIRNHIIKAMLLSIFLIAQWSD